MVPEFIVVLSFSSPDGLNDTIPYVLSDYKSDDNKSAYRILKEKVLYDASSVMHVNWVSVNMVIEQQLITYMQGTLEWFKGVEYFKKLIGDMGSVDAITPASHGFIDQKHGIRVEFENGVVAISGI